MAARVHAAARDLIALAAALALPAVVYHSITRSYFHSDDFVHLQQIVNEPLVRFLLTPSAGHVYVIRNLVFYLSYHAFRTHAEWYFGTVLLTHLLNVALLYTLIRLLTGRRGVASFGASLWGIVPAHEGTLGWYSVYGQVLAATCMLVVLVGVARRWRAGASPTLRDAAIWGVLLVVGATCFGVGIGIALAFPAVVLLLFAGSGGSRAARTLLVVVLPVVVAAGYWGVHKLYAAWYGYPADQAIVFLVGLLADWRQPLAMLGHLLAVGVATLVGGLAYPSARYPDVTGYTLVAALGAALIVDLLTGDASHRRLQIALLATSIGAYAMIAAGRGPLYAGAPSFPAHGATLWRYHYVGPIPLAAVLCLMLARAADALRIGPRTRVALLAGWFAFAGTLYVTSDWQIDHFDSDRRTTGQVVAAITGALAQAPPSGMVTLRNQRFPPAIVDVLFGGWASVFTIYFPETADQRLRFVEPDERVRARALPGSRLARVLVPAVAGVPPPAPLPLPALPQPGEGR